MYDDEAIRFSIVISIVMVLIFKKVTNFKVFKSFLSNIGHLYDPIAKFA